MVQTAFLGDVVFTSPLVRALKRRFPASRLTLVVAPRGEAIGRHMPGVDEVRVFDKRGRDRSPLALWRTGRELECDLMVVPHPSARSAALAAFARANVTAGPGTFPQRLAFDITADLSQGTFVERMLSLARALGATTTPDLHLTVSDEEVARARTLLGPGRFVGAVIGSEWATKRLPPASWASVLDTLSEQGVTPVLLGSPKETELADQVRAASRDGSRYRSFVGNSVEESLALLSASATVIGGDTGLVHAARALGIPAVIFFGPTDPAVHVWERSSKVVRLGLKCQPCHSHGPNVCPLGHHDCLRTLPAEQLVDAVREQLK